MYVCSSHVNGDSAQHTAKSVCIMYVPSRVRHTEAEKDHAAEMAAAKRDHTQRLEAITKVGPWALPLLPRRHYRLHRYLEREDIL